MLYNLVIKFGLRLCRHRLDEDEQVFQKSFARGFVAKRVRFQKRLQCESDKWEHGNVLSVGSARTGSAEWG
jgi:hypothetical protein